MDYSHSIVLKFKQEKSHSYQYISRHNLKYYLDNIDLAREQANKGTLWAKKHFSHEATKDFVDSVLNE